MPQGATNMQLPTGQNGRDLPIPALGASFTIAYDASTASASTMGTYAAYASPLIALRVTTTTEAFLTSDVAPTALADGTHHYCPAGVPQDIVVPASHKLALVKLGSAGSAYCTVLR